ncbi:spore coat protein CotF [Paenibacillus forsythiae]|uniref:Spore coat protein CotF n=1 Tax=Paenibacillus forsythiae TaxID=365616 RepID=A0ABU3H2G6_9BACL|nr:spore coat protein [Paenibacillus forsythiae]MDT3424666.1 spore coat protein CotF [Paenibacillus forsythiae]
MPLGSHEAHELNELLLSCTNSIQSMALFLSQAKDPELRDMIARHYAVHVQDYNMKVEYANRSYSADTLNVPSLQMSAAVSMPSIQYPPMEPKVQLQQLDDRAIATSYLLTLKRAGREYAWSAFECSTPQLRAFLEDAFRMCSHQAFEVWQYMARKGLYPVIMASNEAINAMQQIYQSVPEHQPGQLYR